MSTKIIDAPKASKELQELLSMAVAGTEVVFTEGNTPIARLVPAKQRVAGLHSGAIWMSKDFDEPLSEEFLLGNEVAP